MLHEGYLKGYVQRNGGALIPDGFNSQPKPGRARTKVVPRFHSDNVRRLAKANGWTPEQTEAKVAEVVARKGSDVFVPRTKAVRTIHPSGRCRSTKDENPLMAVRPFGDAVEQEALRLCTVTESYTDRIRRAVALGMVDASVLERRAQ